MTNVGVSKENGFIKLLKMVKRFGGNGSYISKDAIYCFPWLLFWNKNKIRTSSFWDDGFSDWKHLNPRIGEYENSDYHSNCVNDWKEFEKRLEDRKTIDDELQVIQNEKK